LVIYALETRQAILATRALCVAVDFSLSSHLSKSFIASSANTPALIVIDAKGAFAAMSAHD
jgi:hypothetical protein